MNLIRYFSKVFLCILVLPLYATAVFADCPVQTALQFDGINDYVDFGDIDEYEFGDENFSISVWFYTKGPHGGTGAQIIGKYNGSNNGRQWQLFQWNSGQIFFYTNPTGLISTHEYLNSTTSDYKNQWIHVVATRNGSTKYLYINGKLDTTGSTSGVVTGKSTKMYISVTDSPDEGMDHFFNGIIDEAVIYNRALSEDEVKQLYCCGCVPSDSNMIGYWDFNESSGQTAHDSSGKGYDGTLGSGPTSDVSDPCWIDYNLPLPITYYVDDDAENDPIPGISGPTIGDGNSDPLEDGSCEHPFDSIQEAVDKAIADADFCPATILVRDGFYYGTGNHNIDPCGTTMTIKSENGPRSCIINCQNQARGFILTNDDANIATIDGFLIFDGIAIGGDINMEDECGGAIYCQDSSPVIKNCVMIGNYASWSGGAVFLYDSNAVITHCEIMVNDCESSAGGICGYGGNPVIENCVIANNFGYWSGGLSSISDCNMTITNCTIADNFSESTKRAGGLHCFGGDASIKNSIFWNNTGKQIMTELTGIATVTYSDVEMPESNTTWPGIGNINVDPLFAYWLGFYHLQSTEGRWTPIYITNGDLNNNGFINFEDFAIFADQWLDTGLGLASDINKDGLVGYEDLAVFVSNWLQPGENEGGWVKDDVTSPCIDMGDPNSEYFLEPSPNGNKINMGAFGNTLFASKSGKTPDLNHDGYVNFKDFAILADAWLDTEPDMPTDLNNDGITNKEDLAIFTKWWLWGKK